MDAQVQTELVSCQMRNSKIVFNPTWYSKNDEDFFDEPEESEN